MEVKGLVIQSLWMGDASHLTRGATICAGAHFISFTLALTFMTDGTIVLIFGLCMLTTHLRQVGKCMQKK